MLTEKDVQDVGFGPRVVPRACRRRVGDLFPLLLTQAEADAVGKLIAAAVLNLSNDYEPLLRAGRKINEHPRWKAKDHPRRLREIERFEKCERELEAQGPPRAVPMTPENEEERIAREIENDGRRDAQGQW